MRPNHQEVFFRTAHQAECWIGLREPNPLADRWIGMPGHIPKVESCKAKTADNPAFPYAGLVTSPQLRPDAFTPITKATADLVWNQFTIGGMLPDQYTIELFGEKRGLLKQNGSYVHADFDLMALTRAGEHGEFMDTSKSEQRELYAKVQPALNHGLGVPMIQHGAEFMWSGGVGARESEFVLWFGPERRIHRWPSSMPKGGH